MTSTTMNARSATLIRHALKAAYQDINIGRVERSFENWTDAQLDVPSYSGNITARQYLETCRVERDEYVKAEALLEELLSAKGL